MKTLFLMHKTEIIILTVITLAIAAWIIFLGIPADGAYAI